MLASVLGPMTRDAFPGVPHYIDGESSKVATQLGDIWIPHRGTNRYGVQQNERWSCLRPTGNDVCRPKLRGNTQTLIRYIPECENFIVGSVVPSFAF